MRKLASIRKIIDIQPIPNADAIEVVTVDGWDCVSKKGEFKVGDLCVYFEVDSFLPVRSEFEFLRKGCFRSTTYLGDGFRLKTIRLRGQLSQGLVLPVSTFPFPKEPEIDDDVTGLLGVQKWEVPISAQLAGICKNTFPSWIRKTDQERVQNLYNKYYEQYKDTVFTATMKLDGSSMTVYYKDGEVGVCSRNMDLIEDDNNTFWKTAKKYNLPEVLKAYGKHELAKNIAIQGELMGPGVQGNRENLPDHQFFVFNIWDIDEQRYLTWEEETFICYTLYDLGADYNIVPYLKQCIPFQLTLPELLKASEIESINHDIAEGIVYQTLDRTFSFKVINNQFLLGEK